MKIGCLRKWMAVCAALLLTASVWAACGKDSCEAAKKQGCGEKTKQCQENKKACEKPCPGQENKTEKAEQKPEKCG